MSLPRWKAWLIVGIAVVFVFPASAARADVTQPSVTVSPPSAGSAARTIYTIGFATSATGGLSGNAGSQLKIVLPSGTSAASMNNSSVIDTTTAGGPQVGGCFEGATAVNVTCDIFGGSSVAPGDQVSVELDGIINPTVGKATSETLAVATTSDTTPVTSSKYTVRAANPLGQPSVTVSPPSAGSAARTIYTIGFATSATGGLSGNAGSQLKIVLPSGTSAASMNNSSVIDTTTAGGPQVGGCFEGATAVNVTCDIFGGSSVAPGDQVSVELDGIINPTVGKATSETLAVATTSDTTPVTSSKYTVRAANPLGQPSVTVSPPSAGSAARTIYTIGFATSATGGLSGNAGSQLKIVLPSGTSAASMNNSSVIDTTTAGGPQVGGCFEGATAVNVTCDIFGGSSVAPGDQVSVELDGIINPTVGKATSETLAVATTSDTTPVTSSKYTVRAANPLGQPSVTVSPPSAGSAARTIYTIGFATSATGGLSGNAGSQLKIVLPSGTSAASMNNSSVIDTTTAGGPQVGGCFEGATAVNVTCDIFGGSSVAPGDQVSVELDGIINPTVGKATSETLAVATTSDTTPVTSSKYTVRAANPLGQPSVALTNSAPNAAGVGYTIGFATSATGGLSGNAGSQLKIVLPSGTSAASMNNSSVIDTTTAGGPQVGGCFEGATAVNVTCDIFGGSSVAPGDQVSVELDGIINPTVGKATSETLAVATTSDTTPVTSSKYTVRAANPLGQPSVTVSPPSAGSAARTVYTIGFATSATGGLSGNAGSQLKIVLPSGTSAASMNNSSVIDTTTAGGPQVGGCFEGATAVNVTCDIFGGSSVAPGDQVSVELDGIINPTVGKATSETLAVATTSDTTPVTSSKYTVRAANPLGQPSVALTNSAPNAAGVGYTIGFATSATGGLSGNAGSQLKIVLPSGTSAASMNNSSVIDTTTAGGPQVGGCFEGATAVNVTCDIFGGSSVAPGDQVSVELDGIINPTVGKATSETLAVATTSDTTPVTSGPYTIGGAPPRPTVTGVSPSSGPVGGGTSVTITGTAFNGTTAVNFGGTAAASFTVNSDSQITAVSPPGSPGPVDVTVTASGGTSAANASDRFSYQLPAPTVTIVNPGSGPATGGTSVTITGTNFTGTTAVNFGGTAAASFTVNSDSQITAVSPPGSPGPVDVTVTASGGTSAANASDRFSYQLPAPTVTSVNPGSGPATGGTSVTITGTNFTGATAVSFGGTAAASFTVNSDLQITATSPAGSGTVDVTVATPNATSAKVPADRFEYTIESPTVVTGIPSGLSSSAATLSGSVNPLGLPTTADFEYGLDTRYGGAGSGIAYTNATPSQSIGSDFSAHAVSASVSGLVPNALYHVRLVASTSSGTVFGADQTFMTGRDPAPPAPVLGKEVNVKLVSGLVFIKPPPGKSLGHARLARAALAKGQGFVPLTEARQIPSGSQIDSRQGSLQVSAASILKRGKPQIGTFGGAIFKLAQDRRKITKGLSTLSLLEAGFPGAPTFASCNTTAPTATTAPPARAARLPSKVLQTLHANVHGHFRTRGRYSSATVRGTKWSTRDQCNGTLTIVQRGTVQVQDFARHKTITLHAGHRYLAKAITRKHTAKYDTLERETGHH